jgi:predicted glycoside hydrolase/deacetylase ChbG (UPF0249 family)
MIIINADDYGQNRLVTDRILICFEKERITATSAMVFMEDSERAAALARNRKIDVGLHLNFTQELTQFDSNSLLRDYQTQIIKYLKGFKYNFLIYNPVLKKQFEYVFRAQIEEFERLYESSPSHIDGHHHMHLCANMIIQKLIPAGQKVRRNFYYDKGEKNLLNRTYRSFIDGLLQKRYCISDYYYSCQELLETGRLASITNMAKVSIIELGTHPEADEEFQWLMGEEFNKTFCSSQLGKFTQLN